MDTVHWPQEISMEEMVTKSSCSKAISSNNSSSSLERKARPQKESAVNCPRCNSTNTKFCYYNNYSLSQPRYFCKTCRRYWTEGGSLRNVPVGGGSRKNKRSSSSSSSSITSSSSISSSISKKLPDLVVPPAPLSQNPRMMHHGQDLNLGFPSSHDFNTISELIQAPANFDGTKNNNNNTTNSALQLLTGRGGMMMNSFIPMPVPDSNSVYSSSGELMIPMTTEFKIPSLNFSLDGIGGSSNSSGRLLFPFEDLKTTSNDDGHQNRDQLNGDTNGFWSGMLGGGSW